MARHVISIEDNQNFDYKEESLLEVHPTKLNTPKKILDMQALYQPGHFSYDDKIQNFCRQGKFMKDFEDDYPYNDEFDRAFPVYHDCNTAQLRGYFSWRKQIRQKNYLQTNDGYPKMYLYELMNLLTVSSAEEACTLMEEFQIRYARKYSLHVLDSSITKWLRQMVVYYHLDTRYVNHFYEDLIQEDMRYQTLLDETSNQENLWDTLKKKNLLFEQKSSYSKISTELYERIVCSCWKGFIRHYDRKYVLAALGKVYSELPFRMFSDAIFLSDSQSSYEICMDPYRTYYCKNGKWTCLTLWNSYEKNNVIPMLFKEIERQIREVFQVGRSLKETSTDQDMKILIRKTVMEEMRLEHQKETRIHIDHSQLGLIRKLADDSREKLLTEEEIEVEENHQEDTKVFGTLSEGATFCLLCMIHEESYDAYLENNHLLESVIVDEINDYFFDTFMDTIIIYEEDQPKLADDYRNDVGKLVGGNHE